MPLSTIEESGVRDSTPKKSPRNKSGDLGSSSTARVSRPDRYTLHLTEIQLQFDERIRTLCLVICASAVLFAAAWYGREILVPFLLALALKYLLCPLVNVLSCAGLNCRWRIPRGMAIALSIIIAFGLLSGLTGLVTHSVIAFASHASAYDERVEEIINLSFQVAETLQSAFGETGNATAAPHGQDEAHHISMQEVQTELQLQAREVDLSALVTLLLGTLKGLAENTLYILLFLVFLLVADKEPATPHIAYATGEAPPEGHDSQAASNRLIFVYIKGKLLLSCFVSSAHGLALWAVGLDLWLVFAILTFALNFIPNVGMVCAVLLPMPLVVLDPAFGTLQIAIAFFVPAAVGTLSKDVLEPLMIGHSTSLQPVVLMLAILVWGSVWGITGMLLAVPITAVARIYLLGIDHPLSKYVARKIAGTDSTAEEEEEAAAKEAARTRLRLHKIALYARGVPRHLQERATVLV